MKDFDSFENIDHRGSKIVSPKPRNVGNSPGFYDENEQNLSELDILSKEDDKVLEIPAFLRRQVN